MKKKLSITIDEKYQEKVRTIYRAMVLEAVKSKKLIPSESNVYERIIFAGVAKENLKRPSSYWSAEAKKWLKQTTIDRGKRDSVNRESLLKYGLISAALAYLSKEKELTDEDLQEILMMHELFPFPNEQSRYCND